jgi:hypothetical protein
MADGVGRTARRFQTEAQAACAAAGIEAAKPRDAPGLDLEGWRLAPIPGHERAGSSTWQSVARGRTVESDVLDGEIVLLSRLAGLPGPVNSAVARRVASAALAGSAPAGLGEEGLTEILVASVHPVPAATLLRRAQEGLNTALRAVGGRIAP